MPFGTASRRDDLNRSVTLKTKARQETGYAWGLVIVDDVTNALLSGPSEVIASSRQDILQQAAATIQGFNCDIFVSLRNRPNN